VQLRRESNCYWNTTRFYPESSTHEWSSRLERCKIQENAPPTKAPQELHVSEPSVYQQVKSLQTTFARSLYRKVGREIELTPEGRAFCTETIYGRIGADPNPVCCSGCWRFIRSLYINTCTCFGHIQLRASVQMFKVILGPRAAPFIERLAMNEKVDLGLITNATSSNCRALPARGNGSHHLHTTTSRSKTRADDV